MKSLAINKYFVGLGAALLTISAVVAGVAMTSTPTEAQANNRCKVTASMPNIGKQIKKDRKFTLKDGRAYIAVTVHGKKCKMPVSVASWKAPSANGRPYSQQTFYAGNSRTLREGRHLMSVAVPPCYFQVDLIHGLDPHPNGTTGPGYGPKLFIAGAIGGTRSCKPPKQPVAACVEVNVQKLSRTQFSISAQASARNGAKIRGYTFTVHNNGQVVSTKKITSNKLSAKFTYTQAQPGTYAVKVVVDTSVGKKTDANCVEGFTVKRPTPQPGTVDVCDPQTGKIINVPEEDEDKYLPIGSPECEEAPETPPVDEGDVPTASELPTTGPVEVIAQLLGATSLTTAGSYYLASRRQ
jgi:hypothetical protein